MFEILYPEHRIVVDYGGLEDRVLLDVIDNETGRGAPPDMLPMIAREIGCPVAETIGIGEDDAFERFL
ncbi:MAG: hypothetical protein SFV54_02440, partial [Bryobacteraceae bacterium]|nr:hypothetical protein [Bryobacteraceae bacterium]